MDQLTATAAAAPGVVIYVSGAVAIAAIAVILRYLLLRSKNRDTPS